MQATRQKVQWLVPLAAVLVLGGMKAWQMTLPDAASGKAFLDQCGRLWNRFRRG